MGWNTLEMKSITVFRENLCFSASAAPPRLGRSFSTSSKTSFTWRPMTTWSIPPLSTTWATPSRAFRASLSALP